MAVDDYLERLKDEALSIGRAAVDTGGVRVSIKTNLGPEIPVSLGGSQAEGEGGGLLGFKAAVIIRDRKGQTVARYGKVPETEPFKVILLLAPLAILGLVLVRGLMPRR